MKNYVFEIPSTLSQIAFWVGSNSFKNILIGVGSILKTNNNNRYSRDISSTPHDHLKIKQMRDRRQMLRSIQLKKFLKIFTKNIKNYRKMFVGNVYKQSLRNIEQC